jgi:hypothetical protein
MGNSVRRYLGYGLVQGHAPSGPLVLNWQRQGGNVYTLRIQDQAKQVTHSGPPFSINFFEEQPFSNTGSRARK